MRRLLLSLVLVLFAPFAFAISPTPGLWWNPSESGRGFNIELINDAMVVTTFIYDHAGQPIWYLSAGHYNAATGVFDGAAFDAFHGGQCFGCPYTPPVGIPAAAGPIKVVFATATTATLYWQDGAGQHAIPIQRDVYAFGTPNDYLYGGWALTLNVGGLVDGEWIDLTTPYTSGGVQYVAGHLDGNTGDVALGDFDAPSGNFYLLLKIGNFYDFYRFTPDERRWVGVGWIYPVGGAPTGPGSPMFAARVFWRAELAGLGITAQSAAHDGAAATHQAALSAQQAMTAGRPDVRDEAHRAALERALMSR